jgi:hypothetical protein
MSGVNLVKMIRLPDRKLKDKLLIDLKNFNKPEQATPGGY